MKIGQLSKLEKLVIGQSDLLASLPSSLGDLSSLTELLIGSCDKLEYLPDSTGRLVLLEKLTMMNLGVKSFPVAVCQLTNLKELSITECPISALDLGAGSFGYSLCNLKRISLRETELSKISISEDYFPSLEYLFLEDNDHITEIKVLPTTVKDKRGIVGLVNLRFLVIINCHKLYSLPTFAQFPSLQNFILSGCIEVKKIQGLQHCRELEVLRAETSWEEPGIESLESPKRLRKVVLRENTRANVDGCIQSIQKCPVETARGQSKMRRHLHTLIKKIFS
ncbi:putative disease resistance protein At4g19050 [Cryptomeria japonica]|uniref:putative disease resistance protein At4g19050 n=1 Tax=Cryptomeria japonica TaxID=3369 RepID=UPI0025AD3583|nr:putative disease resistance protein At4g19050 [Cryptomeria japonica]